MPRFPSRQRITVLTPPANPWATTNGKKCYICSTDSLLDFLDELGGAASYTLTETVVKSGDNYTYTEPHDSSTITFNMTSGVLTSITLSGREGHNGTYEPVPETYTVTFEMNGHGTSIDSLTNVTSGSTITAPTAPTAEGFTFGGWYKESTCENEWKFDTDTVTNDTTLYAKWEQAKTIGDILNTVSGDFPTSDDPSSPPDNAWAAQDDQKCYINGGNINFKRGSRLAYDPLSTDLEKTDDGYILKYLGTDDSLSFKMENDKLVSITVTYTGYNASLSGTYTPPAPPA